MKITPNALVAIRYRLRNLHGDTMESIMDKGPIQYIQGAGAVLPSLEQELIGMQPGETKTLLVSDDTEDNFYVDVIIDAVRTATEQEIKNNNFLNQYPEEHCGPDCIC
jgi:FKBP-type peptidyl-prolyl cis-trans isomerase SlyD